MYTKKRMYNSDVHIYEFDPLIERIDADFGTRGKLEPLSKIGSPRPNETVACKINATFFNFNGSNETIGTYVDEGIYYNPPNSSFLDVIFTEEYKLLIKKLKDLQEVAFWQGNGFWVIAGSFSLVLDGKIDITNTQAFPHWTERHPRTAIGQKEDGKIVLVVVQGRITNNAGVTAKELADIMFKQGCINAINLDGGGSSEMIVGNRIVNRPSDGAERNIGAALIVYETKEVQSMKVYISPSTQDNNKGVGDYGTEEFRMNQVADVVVPLLIYNGFEVYRNKPSMTVLQAIEDSNNNNVSLHVAIHSNAIGDNAANSARGCEVWYYTGSQNGKKISQSIYGVLSLLTPSSDRGIKESTALAEVSRTRAAACIVEVAFHDSVEDAIWITENIPQIGEAIAKGICNYFGKQFKKPDTGNVDWQQKYLDLLGELKSLAAKYNE